MTFCLCVHEVGLNPNATLRPNLDDKPATSNSFDHPNADIMYWMGVAKDKGFFNDRLFLGETEAVSKKPQAPDERIHHPKPDLIGFV